MPAPEVITTERLRGERLGPRHVDTCWSRSSPTPRDLVAYTLPHNGASRRVMVKLGFQYEKTAQYKTFGDHVLYRLMNT